MHNPPHTNTHEMARVTSPLLCRSCSSNSGRQICPQAPFSYWAVLRTQQHFFFLSSSWTQNKCLGTRNEVGNQSLVFKMGPAPEHRTRHEPEVWYEYFKATWENVGRTTPRSPRAWKRPSFKGGKLWPLILKTQESKMTASYVNEWSAAQWCMRTRFTVCTINFWIYGAGDAVQWSSTSLACAKPWAWSPVLFSLKKKYIHIYFFHVSRKLQT